MGIGTKYNAEYKKTENLTGEELKSKYSTEYNRLIAVLNGGDGSNTEMLGNWISSFFTEPKAEAQINSIASTSYGYTVRCVKE